MFSYLGLTSNEDYMAFAEMCADAHEPSGLASGIAGANHMGPPAVVQFDAEPGSVEASTRASTIAVFEAAAKAVLPSTKAQKKCAVL